MYKNFYSAQGSSIVGVPKESRLLTKPLLLNVLHGGGQIFENEQDPNARLIAYWITPRCRRDRTSSAPPATRCSRPRRGHRRVQHPMRSSPAAQPARAAGGCAGAAVAPAWRPASASGLPATACRRRRAGGRTGPGRGAYIELRTGPGRLPDPPGRGTRQVDHHRTASTHTDWFKVRTEAGKVSWVDREQLRARSPRAASKSFRDVLIGDYLRRRLDFGGGPGAPSAKKPMLKALDRLPLQRHAGLEATAAQVQGQYSGTSLWT